MKTRHRPLVSYDSLKDIIKALDCNPHSSQVWVGKNYSKAQLIEDLKQIQDNHTEMKKELDELIYLCTEDEDE